jgi:Na+-translocating ferredoxin:NAD+ oxidoreductase RnfG subunit
MGADDFYAKFGVAYELSNIIFVKRMNQMFLIGAIGAIAGAITEVIYSFTKKSLAQKLHKARESDVNIVLPSGKKVKLDPKDLKSIERLVSEISESLKRENAKLSQE